MNKLTEEQIQVYKERFQYELNLFKEKGYLRYFLIIEDIIGWSREQGMIQAFCRGSAGGCLISFLTKITNVDPIKYDLSIDRFISRDRKDYPDIDWDTSGTDRELIKKHLQNQYGEGKVAGISTVLKMSDKSVVRSVAKAYGIKLFEVNAFCDKIVEDIESALETNEGKEFQNKYPDVIKYSLKLRDKPKAQGMHACGLILASEDLRESNASNLIERNGEVMLNWPMEFVEEQGYIKLDLLALNALEIIGHCVKLIKENYGEEIDITKIDFDDENIYKQISSGKCTGVFQFDTFSMSNLCKRLLIRNIKDVIHSISIVRPGPNDSGTTDLYVERQHGAEWDKKHPVYEKVLKESYALPIFQEQIMAVISKIGGMSLSDAEKIRRLISKKKSLEEFKPYKDGFISGCLKTGYLNEQEAEEFWTEMQFHSKYSFNKSHSTGYGLLSASMAWLKYYYLNEFYASILTKGAEGKKANIIKEALKEGLTIKPPKVGISHPTDWIVKEKTLFIPFSEIKGIGPSTVEAAATAQKDNGGFFNIGGKEKKSKKLETILEDIKAYNDENPSEEMLKKYFDFDIILDYKKKYPNLEFIRKNYFKNINSDINISWEDLLNCNFPDTKIIRTKLAPKSYLRGLGVCEGCEYSQTAKKPLHPKFGRYNVMIIGDSPDWYDDKKNEMFVGQEGDKALFPMLKKFGLSKDMFYLTSFVKCFPGKGNKICKENIGKCSRWLKEELTYLKPNVIMAFGNNALSFFKDQETGIKNMNGCVEWNEKYGAWVCYSVRPYSYILGGSEGESEFEKGVRGFVRVVRKLGITDKEY